MSKTELKLDTLTEQLTLHEKSEVFETYWKAWSVNGFGTLTKKDADLLMFLCLKKVLANKENSPSNNYDWARLLRLTPTKIKNMRLESHLRFGHLIGENGTEDARKFLEHFHRFQSIDINGLKDSSDLNDVKVSFVVEDPVIQMEIENRLKLLGTYLDFHRNREVLKLRLVDFFKLGAKDTEQEIINQWVAEKAKEKSIADGLLGRVTAKEYAQKSEADKLMTFIDDFTAFAQVKPLTDHLKKIFTSQKER